MANGNAAHQVRTELDALCDVQSVYKLDAEAANRAIDLGVAKQQLDGAEVAGLSVDTYRLVRRGACVQYPLASKPIAVIQS